MFESNSKLAAQSLSAGYSAEAVLRNLDLELDSGSITAIIGANGSGKSTLLKTLARKLTPSSGAVILDGKSISTISRKTVSEDIAFLSQHPAAKSTETVFDFVSKNAVSNSGISRLSPKLKSEVESLLARCGLTESSELSIGELSGGQRQRTMIAAALVKNPKVLLLDEPTTSLDYAHQLEVINLLSSLKRERNMIILAVIHDLNLAARFADRVLILKNGEILADGEASAVITPTNMAEAFNILARVIEDPVAKTPMVIPIRQLVNQ